jgi:peptide chain release factor 1
VNTNTIRIDSVLNGELDDVVQALLDADKAAKLSSTN